MLQFFAKNVKLYSEFERRKYEKKLAIFRCNYWGCSLFADSIFMLHLLFRGNGLVCNIAGPNSYWRIDRGWPCSASHNLRGASRSLHHLCGYWDNWNCVQREVNFHLKITTRPVHISSRNRYNCDCFQLYKFDDDLHRGWHSYDCWPCARKRECVRGW